MLGVKQCAPGHGGLPPIEAGPGLADGRSQPLGYACVELKPTLTTGMLRRAFVKREVPEVMPDEFVPQLFEGELDVSCVTSVDPAPVNQIHST